jgi:hypothetical protein
MCLVNSAHKCLHYILNLPLVRDWVLHHLDDLVYAQNNAYLWQLVFDGPNPLDVTQTLTAFGIPLVWRFPDGFLKGRTLLHLVGWWALSCVRSIDYIGETEFISYDDVII